MILVDSTHMTYVAFLKKKSEALREFKLVVANMNNQGHGRVRCLRTDNGTEYCNKEFKKYLTSSGIEHKPSAPYTPEQNGLAERTNRTLIEKSHAKLPENYWAEAVSVAAYLKNMSPTRVVDNKIPEEVFLDTKLSDTHLRTFGCLAYVHIPKEKRKKWDIVAKPCIFVRYTKTTSQYRFIDPATKRLVVSTTAKFCRWTAALLSTNCVIHSCR